VFGGHHSGQWRQKKLTDSNRGGCACYQESEDSWLQVKLALEVITAAVNGEVWRFKFIKEKWD